MCNQQTHVTCSSCLSGATGAPLDKSKGKSYAKNLLCPISPITHCFSCDTEKCSPLGVMHQGMVGLASAPTSPNNGCHFWGIPPLLTAGGQRLSRSRPRQAKAIELRATMSLARLRFPCTQSSSPVIYAASAGLQPQIALASRSPTRNNDPHLWGCSLPWRCWALPVRRCRPDTSHLPVPGA